VVRKHRRGSASNDETDRDPRWTPKPISALSLEEGVETPWVWRGYLARGCTTNLTGLWKVGKTTILTYLFKAMDGSVSDFCGQHIEATKVLLVTEEGERRWAARRDTLSIGDHVHVINRPFLGVPDHRTWERFITGQAELVKAQGFGVVLLDTLFNLWPVRDENDAAACRIGLMPLNALTEAGAAVLLMMHPAKTDAGEARATRGSGSIPAFADIIVEMRRFDPERREDTRRTLTAYGRFDEDDTPPELVLVFDRDRGYSVVGTKAEARSDDRLEVILGLLRETGTDSPKTVEEVLAEWPIDGISKPSIRTLRDDLNAAFIRGAVQRTGNGKKADPFRFSVQQNAIPASSPPYTPTLPESNLTVTPGTDPLLGKAIQRFGAIPIEIRSAPGGAT
jgi:hypothetical protein